MKASELRLGNLCQNKQGNVIHINVNHLIILSYGIENEFNPIPLTEEWLLRLGFSEIGGCNEKDFTNGDYNIFINSIGEVNFLFFREGDWYKKLDYVHQLQNLYFALTGEELTLNK